MEGPSWLLKCIYIQLVTLFLMLVSWWREGIINHYLSCNKSSQTKLGVISISSKYLNFLDLELKENSRKIKLLEIGLEDRRSVDPNLCPKNRKTFLLSISAVFVMQFLLEFTWFLELNWQVNRINSRSRQVTYNNTTNCHALHRLSNE